MFYVKGSIENLVAWFEQKGSEKQGERFLGMCLLVAGSLQDKDFFEAVFANRDILNVITGERIAVFLFVPNSSTLLATHESGNTIVLPGQRLGTHDLENLWMSSVSNVSAKQSDVAEAVVSATINIATEIISYFRLTPYDIPCILFRTVDQKEPLLLRTKGVADVETFFDLLRELNGIYSDITTTVPKLREIENTTKHLKEKLLRAKSPKSIERLERRLTNVANELARIESDSHEVTAVRKKLAGVIVRYERKCRWWSRIKGVKEFFGALLGIAKKAKEATDIYTAVTDMLVKKAHLSK